jgi:hypothetical protein
VLSHFDSASLTIPIPHRFKRTKLTDIYLPFLLLSFLAKGVMVLHFSVTAAFLGAVVALASFDDVSACAGHGAPSDHHYEDQKSQFPPNVRRSRRLLEDDRQLFSDGFGSESNVKPFCGTPEPPKEEVIASMNMVKEFYEGLDNLPGGRRRLQNIEVPVNFVVVSKTDGTGNITQAQVQNQVDFLTAAFAPDFKFVLTNTKFVTNDVYFNLLDFQSPNELAMKTAHRRGGKETLNIYSLEPKMSNAGDSVLGGYAYFPMNTLSMWDGVVMLYKGVPGGGVPEYGSVQDYWNEGDVRFGGEASSVPLPVSYFLCSLFILLDSCWCTRSVIGYNCIIRLKRDALALAMAWLTRNPKPVVLAGVAHQHATRALVVVSTQSTTTCHMSETLA